MIRFNDNMRMDRLKDYNFHQYGVNYCYCTNKYMIMIYSSGIVDIKVFKPVAFPEVINLLVKLANAHLIRSI